MRDTMFDVGVAILKLVCVGKLTRRIPENDTYFGLVISRYVLEDEPVSTFTLQYFGIQVGEQSGLLTAVPTDRTVTRDQKDMMSVSRCIRDTCGAHRAFQFKFIFDDASDVIYCLSPTVDEVDFLRGKIFKVEEEDMMPFEFVFYKVASVVQHGYGRDTFAQIPCRSMGRIILCRIQ
ncbi:hypothetical protein U9M48_035602 [Paspalum notatum var. saurae]|uniref:Uncharacterized protein n=1 Tax=Paspalum notatum var. saurae TaxID=547442 RepID=A0AAQ3UFF9_PASNO